MKIQIYLYSFNTFQWRYFPLNFGAQVLINEEHGTFHQGWLNHFSFPFCWNWPGNTCWSCHEICFIQFLRLSSRNRGGCLRWKKSLQPEIKLISEAHARGSQVYIYTFTYTLLHILLQKHLHIHLHIHFYRYIFAYSLTYTLLQIHFCIYTYTYTYIL